MQKCTQQVDAAEKVISVATSGIDHWRLHVKAQTDHLNGTISRTQMEAEFKRTKLLGPGDKTAWEAATKAWREDDKACAPVAGADKQSATTLQVCSTRLTAIETAMPAARAAMGDWFAHQRAMARSAEGLEADPMGVWMHTYYAAPKNLNAWAAAKRQLDRVPQCAG
ncbi:MAG: hypothetical protein J2P23_00230 [Microlunatus sp.]|nr:hypothetical protein [Microlunatus sp.]